MKMRKVGCVSLGCPKNLVDSERILAKLIQKGVPLTSPEDADVVIVNTCAFLLSAREEARETIEYWHSRGKKIIVMGCLATYFKEKLKEIFPYIEGSLGVGDLERIEEVVEKGIFLHEKEGNNYLPSRFISTFPYAYLKINEGCSNRCSYCLIPSLRGEHRSYPFDLLIEEARVLVESGIKELIIVGQDTAVYEYQGKRLIHLLRELSSLEGLEWIRVMYFHPLHISEELIEEIAQNPRVVKYMDIPFQHCNDKILKLMNRRISREDISRLVEKLRRRIPHLTLRTTLIVGFPGEGRKEFEELKEFVKEMRFDHLGVFSFSPEPGTSAFHLSPQLEEREKERRRREIYDLQKEIVMSKNRSLKGKVVRVLITWTRDGEWAGRSEREAPEIDGEIRGRGKVKVGDMVRVRIKSVEGYRLEGELV